MGMRSSEPVVGLLVVGAGGHAKVIIDAAEQSGRFPRCAMVDENPTHHGSHVLGVDVIGGHEIFSRLNPAEWRVVIAVGENRHRARLACQIRSLGWQFVSVFHPSSQCGSHVAIGSGSVLLAGAVVNPDASLGSHVIVNTQAIVEHDCAVGDFVHLGPGACLLGASTVDAHAFVGARAIVLPGVRIGRAATVGAGAVVTRDVPDSSVVAGVPARQLRRAPAGARTRERPLNSLEDSIM